MKIVIDRSLYNKKSGYSYQGFYEQICKELDFQKTGGDLADYENLNYHADLLLEFLTYNYDRNMHIIFKNVDLYEIYCGRYLDNYMWRIIIEVLITFVQNFPNNSIEFVPVMRAKSEQN